MKPLIMVALTCVAIWLAAVLADAVDPPRHHDTVEAKEP